MKPIIVGINNPYSGEPRNALAPYPERSAGHRLWKTLHELNFMGGPVTDHRVIKVSYDRQAYMDAFDRVNLFEGTSYSRASTRKHVVGQKFIRTLPQGAIVLLLGMEVRECLNTALSRPLKKIPFHPQVIDGITWRCVPHPSGRSPVYNDPIMRLVVGITLADCLVQAAEESKNAKE